MHKIITFSCSDGGGGECGQLMRYLWFRWFVTVPTKRPIGWPRFLLPSDNISHDVFQAHQLRNEFDEAVKDYQHVITLEPTNKVAKAKLDECRQKIREESRTEKRIFKNMFDKFAAEDTKVRKD